MADLKVITNNAYRNYSTQPRVRRYPCEVREDEGNYSNNTEDLLEKIKVLLDKPLWPEFPDGLYLKPEEAARLYRLTHGAQGLIHILNRSANFRRMAGDYEGEPNIGLSELLESQVWAALIEVGGKVASFDFDSQMRSSPASEICIRSPQTS
jgi:hypothetical protein